MPRRRQDNEDCPVTYPATPIDNGFKRYYLVVPLNPYPENATILYKGKEVGYTKIEVLGGRKIDWGISTEHPRRYREDSVRFGIGTLWAFWPVHWGWRNAENWEVVVPCP